MNRVVETSVFLVHLHGRDFSIFFLHKHKKANKRISDFNNLIYITAKIHLITSRNSFDQNIF